MAESGLTSALYTAHCQAGKDRRDIGRLQWQAMQRQARLAALNYAHTGMSYATCGPRYSTCTGSAPTIDDYQWLPDNIARHRAEAFQAQLRQEAGANYDTHVWLYDQRQADLNAKAYSERREADAAAKLAATRATDLQRQAINEAFGSRQSGLAGLGAGRGSAAAGQAQAKENSKATPKLTLKTSPLFGEAAFGRFYNWNFDSPFKPLGKWLFRWIWSVRRGIA